MPLLEPAPMPGVPRGNGGRARCRATRGAGVAGDTGTSARAASLSPEDTEALRVATESLWQRLHALLLEQQAHCGEPSSEAPVAAGETVSAAAVPAAALEAGLQEVELEVGSAVATVAGRKRKQVARSPEETPAHSCRRPEPRCLGGCGGGDCSCAELTALAVSALPAWLVAAVEQAGNF